MGGRIGDTIEFYYLDTEPMLKFVLESGSGHAIDLTPSRVIPAGLKPRRYPVVAVAMASRILVVGDLYCPSSFLPGRVRRRSRPATR